MYFTVSANSLSAWATKIGSGLETMAYQNSLRPSVVSGIALRFERHNFNRVT